MALCDLPRADLAVLIGNNDFRVYHLRRDLELEELIIDRANTFWHGHVIARIPPRPSSPGDALALYPRSLADTSVPASPQILEAVQRYQSCRGLLTHDGQTLASWRSARPSRRLDSRALSLAHPDIAAQFTTESAGARRFLLRGQA